MYKPVCVLTDTFATAYKEVVGAPVPAFPVEDDLGRVNTRHTLVRPGAATALTRPSTLWKTQFII